MMIQVILSFQRTSVPINWNPFIIVYNFDLKVNKFLKVFKIFNYFNHIYINKLQIGHLNIIEYTKIKSKQIHKKL